MEKVSIFLRFSFSCILQKILYSGSVDKALKLLAPNIKLNTRQNCFSSAKKSILSQIHRILNLTYKIFHFILKGHQDPKKAEKKYINVIFFRFPD